MASGARRAVGNLPAELTTFVGRRSELADIKQALSTSRLVTLVGPGGVGKTRLALRAAATTQRAFPDGTWFVDISPLRDEELLAPAIGSALDLQSRSARWAPAALSKQLESRSILLVLDNCEYLSYACAVLADTLLRNCPDLRMLVTSRQPLEVPGEHLIGVTPLAVPEPGTTRKSPAVLERFDALALFVDRARAAEPRFRLTEQNAGAVAELCYRLDGLPLALELAAARVRHFSPRQILDRLDGSYQLLESGRRVTTPRQRSLRSLIGWSYELCSPKERLLWARLAVFSGTFSAQAAETVCADEDLSPEAILPTLAALVDKSIVATERGDVEVRYRMLVTIRSFGHEQLVAAGGATTFQRRHRDYFRDETAKLYAHWFGPGQASTMAWISTERHNFRAAMDFALAELDDVEGSAIIAAGLGGEAITSGTIGEGLHWINRVLAVLDESSSVRAMLRWVGAWCAMQQGDLDFAESMVKATGTADDPHDSAMTIATLGMCRILRGELTAAMRLFEVARARADAEHDEMCLAVVALHRGVSAYRLGETDRGIALCREAIAISEAHGEQWHRAAALWELSNLLWREGDIAESAEAAKAALRVQRQFHNAVGTASCFETLAWIASRCREYERAARLLGAADALWQATDVQLLPHLAAHKDGCVTETRSVLGERAYTTAHRTGSRASVGDNSAFALGEQAPPRETRPDTEPVPLTKREREIAELIATGASNKDIAATLVISRRTAEAHVEHILSKLGFTSRVQVAAWVTAQHAGATH